MILISHRVNTVHDLKRTDTNHGVEIDIRDSFKDLYIQHDPFKKGVLLKSYLKHFNHKFLICNIKSERIEDATIKILKKFNIKNYFFLDSSFPKIIDLINRKIKKIAIRISCYEGLDTAVKLKNKVNWIWFDTFKGMPNKSELIFLKKLNYKICLVSPELHGIKLNKQKKIVKDIIQSELIDAVCTKNRFLKNWSIKDNHLK